MESLRLPNGASISYQSAGDGFPLVLLPGAEGVAPWLPHMPLLGELCHAIAYEGCRSRPAIDCLPAILDGLRLERVYLASPLSEWLATLEFARKHIQCLEALLLVEFPGSDVGMAPSGPASSAEPADVNLPTLFLLAGVNSPARAVAERLSVHLPGGHTVSLGPPAQGQTDLPRTPQRQFPHLMMKFLLDRERHRNLVRGASFLL